MLKRPLYSLATNTMDLWIPTVPTNIEPRPLSSIIMEYLHQPLRGMLLLVYFCLMQQLLLLLLLSILVAAAAVAAALLLFCLCL